MNRLSKSNKISEHLENDLLKSSGSFYSATTGDITVTVWPEFIDSKNNVSGNLFIWAYRVKIANNNPYSIKLINRYWKITDETGHTQEITGDGVVGEQPKIPTHTSYQYTSGVHLNQPSGIMSGVYQVQKDDGETLDVKIPAFSLDIPNSKGVIN